MDKWAKYIHSVIIHKWVYVLVSYNIKRVPCMGVNFTGRIKESSSKAVSESWMRLVLLSYLTRQRIGATTLVTLKELSRKGTSCIAHALSTEAQCCNLQHIGPLNADPWYGTNSAADASYLHKVQSCSLKNTARKKKIGCIHLCFTFSPLGKLQKGKSM